MRTVFSSLVLFALLSLPVQAQDAHPGVTASMGFMQMLIEGKTKEAYDGASEKFRRVNTWEQFLSFVANSGAEDLETLEVSKATGSADGSNITVIAKGKNKEGKSRQVTIAAVKESDAYRMAHFRVRPVSVSPPPPTNDVGAATKLAQDALQRLAGALDSGKFDSYLNEISVIHRQTFGDQTLIDIGKRLNATHYGPVSNLVDRIQPGKAPEMNGNLARYFFVVDFPDVKRRLLLEFVSLWSEPNPAPWPNRWHLQFFDPNAAIEEPAQEAVVALSRQTMADLFEGFTKADLKPFYEKAAPYFREIVALENFQNSFPAFTGKKVDYSGWKIQEVEVLSSRLSGGTGKQLIVETQIPTPNQPAYATLAFIKENDAWEFIEIFFSSKSPKERAAAQAKPQ